MKKNLLGILTVFALVCLPVAPAKAQSRIATVDLAKVFDKYWKREQAEAALKSQMEELHKQEGGMLDEFKALKEKYNKMREAANDPTLTPEERDKRKNAADDKFKELKSQDDAIRTFDNNAESQLELKQQRLMDTLMQEILTAVNAKAKAAGYSLVLNSAKDTHAAAPVVVFTSGENDITEEILKQLNAAAPAATKPTEAPKTAGKTDGQK
jgi:outer membrane protein